MESDASVAHTPSLPPTLLSPCRACPTHAARRRTDADRRDARSDTKVACQPEAMRVELPVAVDQNSVRGQVRARRSESIEQAEQEAHLPHRCERVAAGPLAGSAGGCRGMRDARAHLAERQVARHVRRSESDSLHVLIDNSKRGQLEHHKGSASVRIGAFDEADVHSADQPALGDRRRILLEHPPAK
eukprot:scaffold9600_cov132-Isochrysis_galbana.AAC.1